LLDTSYVRGKPAVNDVMAADRFLSARLVLRRLA
jgi:hypothetical protein